MSYWRWASFDEISKEDLYEILKVHQGFTRQRVEFDIFHHV